MKRLKERKTKQLLAKTLAFSMLLTQMSGSIGSISVYADGLDTAESDVTVSSNGKKVALEISGTELSTAVETAIHEGQLADLSELRAVSGNLSTEEAWRELLSEGALYTVPLLSEDTQAALSADDVEVRFYVQKDTAKKAEKAQKELVLYGEDTELSGLLAEFADTRMSSLDNAFVTDDGADADYVISGDEKITVLFLNHSDGKRTFTLTVNGEKAVKNLTVASAEASMKSVLNSIKKGDFSEEIASASNLVRTEEKTEESTAAETTAEESAAAEETGAAETEGTTAAEESSAAATEESAAEETSAAADTGESTTAAEESTAAEKTEESTTAAVETGTAAETTEAAEEITEAAAAEEKAEAGEVEQKTLTLGSIRGLMAFDAFFRKASDSNVSEDSDMEKSWKQARKEAIQEARENLESVAAECSTARYLQFTLAELTKFEKNSFVYSDENLTVTATVEDAAAVPADAELRVSPITEDSAQYQAYMEALQSADNASQYSGENTKLYDIAFFAPDADGEMTELQLEKGAVTLKLSYKKEAIENGEALTVNAAEDLSVLHLPVKQEVKDAQAGVATTDLDLSAEDITVEKLSVDTDKVKLAEDNAGIAVASETEESDVNPTEAAATIQSVEFKTEGFSVFALVKPAAAGGNKWSAAEIEAAFGNALDFGVYTKYFTHGTDMEANLAAKEIGNIGSDYGFSGNNYGALNNTITVSKTYTDQNGDPVTNASVTIQLNLEGVAYKSQTITTDADGEATCIFENVAAGAYSLSETVDGVTLTQENSNVTVGNTTYEATFAKSVSKIDSKYSNVNYVGSAGEDNWYNIAAKSRHGVIVIGDKSTYNGVKQYAQRENCIVLYLPNTSYKDEFDMDADFDKLNQLSSDLASAESTDSVLVVNKTYSEMQNSDQNLGTRNNEQLIVVNVDMTGFTPGTEYSLGGRPKVNNTQVPFSWKSTLGYDIIWNFIVRDGDSVSPYSGKINVAAEGVGIMLAPSATVGNLGGNWWGTIIGGTVNHGGSEVHSVAKEPNPVNVAMSIANIKKPADGKARADIEVSKAVSPETWEWGSNSFEFTLKADGNAPMPSDAENGSKSGTATKSNKTVNFGEITYDAAGTYKYTITEVKPKTGAIAGMSYDTTPKTVTVKVTQSTDGKLRTSVDYGSDKTSLTVTNTYKPSEATASLEVKKELKGRNWKDGEEFGFTLAAVTKNAPMPSASVATASNITKKATFGEITYDKAGTYQYTITENAQNDDLVYDTEPHSVTVTVTDNGKGQLTADVKYDENENEKSLTITNIYETVNIPVKKIWEDSNNQDGLRPESITVKLLANGEEVDSAELTADNINPEDNLLTRIVKKVSVILNKDNGWQDTFKDLPKYKDGKQIAYTVQEAEVEGYTGKIETKTEDDVTGFVLTNTHEVIKISVQGIKNWDDCENQDGKRPTHLMLYLYADGKQTQEKEISADDEWQYTFTNLDKYKDGREIQYEVKEEDVKDYQGEITTSSNIVDDRENLIYTLTNCHTPETVNVDVTKKWDGKAQESAEFTLYVDGEATKQKLVLSEDNDWTGSFDKLPKYQEGQVGKEIVYTVVETAVSHYEISEKRTEKDGSIIYVFTNKYIPETTTPEESTTTPETTVPETSTTPETTTAAETTTTAETTTVPETTRRSGGGGGGGGSHNYHSVTPIVETQPEVLGESRTSEAESETTADSPVPKVLRAVRKAVQTGEDSQIAVYAIAFFGCVAALGAWLLMEKRRREE